MPSLPKWMDGKRALNSLTKALADRDLALQVQSRFNSDHDSKQLVMLPGFSMFDQSNGVSASEWCVPRPMRDRDDLLMVYEEYVDRPLGKVPAPDRVARQILQGRTGDMFFGPGLRKPTEWWLPAAQLIALASRMSGVMAVVTDDTVSLDMGDYMMRVERRGCWSNKDRRLHLAVDAADDADSAQLRVPLLITAHPLAKALLSAGAPPAALWAANSAIRCELHGKHPKIRTAHFAPLALMRKTTHVRKRRYTHAPSAMTTCRLIIDEPYPGSHLDLFVAAVPALMHRADFADIVGGVGKDSEERTLSFETCDRFGEFLDLREKELACRLDWPH
jgi:hypothetical protein